MSRWRPIKARFKADAAGPRVVPTNAARADVRAPGQAKQTPAGYLLSSRPLLHERAKRSRRFESHPPPPVGSKIREQNPPSSFIARGRANSHLMRAESSYCLVQVAAKNVYRNLSHNFIGVPEPRGFAFRCFESCCEAPDGCDHWTHGIRGILLSVPSGIPTRVFSAAREQEHALLQSDSRPVPPGAPSGTGVGPPPHRAAPRAGSRSWRRWNRWRDRANTNGRSPEYRSHRHARIGWAA
jgi:hypothetical protein